MSIWCFVYFTLFFLNVHARLLFDYSPLCIIEEDLFWRVYDKHFDEVKKLKVVILGSANHSSDVKEFSNYFLKVMSKNDIFFAEFKVKYKYIHRSTKPLPRITDIDPSLYESNIESKYFIGSRTYWRTVKYYSSDPQHVVIVIVWNVDDLRQALNADRKFIMKHTRSLYSILFVSSKLKECNMWRRKIGILLFLLWKKYKLLNVIALTPCSCDQNKIFIWKPFYPTSNSTWGALDVFPMSIEDHSVHRMLNTIRSMHGYPMKVSIFERLPTATKHLSAFMQQNFIYQNLIHSGGYSGVDGAILENFSKFMKFNLTIVGCEATSECFGSVYPNGTLTTSLGLIASHQVELSANGRFLKQYNTSKIEFTSIIYSDQVCFIVRKAPVVPSWMFLYKAFDHYSWMCIFLTMDCWIFFNILIKILSAMILKKKLEFKMSVFISILHTPNNPNFKRGLAIFTTVCLIFSVIYTGIFQAVAVKIFSIVSRFEDINTLQDLLDDDYIILSSLDIFSEDQTDIIKKLNQKVRKSFDDKALVNVATSSRKYATLERKRDAEYIIESYYTTAEDEPILHIVKECPASYFMAYIVPYDSPYRKRFDQLISVFREAGFIEYWYNLMVENLILEQKVQQNRGRRGKKRPFALKDVQFPFILLMVGLSLSTVIFTIEMFVKRTRI